MALIMCFCPHCSAGKPFDEYLIGAVQTCSSCDQDFVLENPQSSNKFMVKAPSQSTVFLDRKPQSGSFQQPSRSVVAQAHKNALDRRDEARQHASVHQITQGVAALGLAGEEAQQFVEARRNVLQAAARSPFGEELYKLYLVFAERQKLNSERAVSRFQADAGVAEGSIAKVLAGDRTTIDLTSINTMLSNLAMDIANRPAILTGAERDWWHANLHYHRAIVVIMKAFMEINSHPSVDYDELLTDFLPLLGDFIAKYQQAFWIVADRPAGRTAQRVPSVPVQQANQEPISSKRVEPLRTASLDDEYRGNWNSPARQARARQRQDEDNTFTLVAMLFFGVLAVGIALLIGVRSFALLWVFIICAFLIGCICALIRKRQQH